MPERTFKDLVLNPNIGSNLPNKGVDIGELALKGMNVINDIIKNGDQLAGTITGLMGRINDIRGNPDFRAEIERRQNKLQKRTIQETAPPPLEHPPIETSRPAPAPEPKEQPKASPEDVYNWYKKSIETVKMLKGDITLSRFLFFIEKNKEDVIKTISNGMENNGGKL